jgi:hypothetical protein
MQHIKDEGKKKMRINLRKKLTFDTKDKSSETYLDDLNSQPPKTIIPQ